MKHPDREEWVPFLFGEADPEVKRSLSEHLKDCSECAEELQGWRQSLHRLDTWKVPRRKRPGMPALRPVLNLAAAAVLVLGIGFGTGKWVSGQSNAAQLRAGLENSLRTSFLPELRQQVRQEVAGEWQARLNELRQESSSALAKAKTEAVNAAALDTAQAVDQLLSMLRSERAEDQEIVSEWIENLRKHHDTDYLSLRKDLETVASTTDDRIRAAQLKLLELTATGPGADH